MFVCCSCAHSLVHTSEPPFSSQAGGKAAPKSELKGTQNVRQSSIKSKSPVRGSLPPMAYVPPLTKDPPTNDVQSRGEEDMPTISSRDPSDPPHQSSSSKQNATPENPKNDPPESEVEEQAHPTAESDQNQPDPPTTQVLVGRLVGKAETTPSNKPLETPPRSTGGSIGVVAGV
jgi:hypothetical protein